MPSLGQGLSQPLMGQQQYASDGGQLQGAVSAGAAETASDQEDKPM